MPPLTLTDRLEIAGARAVAALPRGAKRRIAGSPIRRDGLELDVDMQLLVKLDERELRAPMSSGTPAKAREDLRRAVRVVAGPPIELAEVREETVSGAAGTLRARLFVPGEDRDAGGGLIVYYHGGGWMIGDLDTHDHPCRLLARAAGARVLSVEYRLAPEHPYPAGFDDCFAVAKWLVENEMEKIAIGGESSGGHLSAVTLVRVRDELDAIQVPAFQLLIYPVTDLVNVAPSRLTFADGFILTKPNMDWYEEQFMGPDGDRSDPRASPLLAELHGAGAPALVVTAGFDPLRDEGEAYARKLRDAGVRTILRRHAGYVHGFVHALILGPGPREAIAEMGGVLRAALGG